MNKVKSRKMENLFNKMLPEIWHEIEELEKKHHMLVTLYYTNELPQKVFFKGTRAGVEKLSKKALITTYTIQKLDSIVKKISYDTKRVELRINILRTGSSEPLCFTLNIELPDDTWKTCRQVVTKQFIESAIYPDADEYFVDEIIGKCIVE